MLILGPAGTGKSLLALTFVVGAVNRGEKAAMFVFDEELGLLMQRAKGLGIDIKAMVDSGNLSGHLLAVAQACLELARAPFDESATQRAIRHARERVLERMPALAWGHTSITEPEAPSMESRTLLGQCSSSWAKVMAAGLATVRPRRSLRYSFPLTD